MSLVYIIPFFIGEDEITNEKELRVAEECIKSLEKCNYEDLIFYNQGGITNEDLFEFLSTFDIKFKVLGEGKNIGKASVMYNSIKFISQNYKNIKYIAEVDIDMIFSPDWEKSLLEYLESTDEPMISPRVITFDSDKNIYKVIGVEEEIEFPNSFEERINILESYKEDIITEGITYPIIHKLEVLKSINSYDVGFLTGKIGYEKESVLLGYNYYMGTKNNWRPKISFKSCVYHEGNYGSLKVSEFKEVSENLKGIKVQYGAYGQKELARIYLEDEVFYKNYNNMIIDNEAYNIKVSEYKKIKTEKKSVEKVKEYTNIEKVEDSKMQSDMYVSRFFKISDEVKSEVFLKIPKEWWSRFYEYTWASKFCEEDDICLDAACGMPHPFKFYLGNKCKEVEAFDIINDINDNSKILESLKENFDLEDIEKAENVINKISFRCRNIKNIDYPEDYFDKIYCISILHLLKGKDILDGLKELKRVLKKDGLLIITVDSPTINVKNLISNINRIGLKVKGELHLNKEKNSLVSKEFGNLSCFRIVVTK